MFRLLIAHNDVYFCFDGFSAFGGGGGGGGLGTRGSSFIEKFSSFPPESGI